MYRRDVHLTAEYDANQDRISIAMNRRDAICHMTPQQALKFALGLIEMAVPRLPREEWEFALELMGRPRLSRFSLMHDCGHRILFNRNDLGMSAILTTAHVLRDEDPRENH